MKPIYNIGLTGGVACGKSTVAALFKEKGYYIIDSDEVAKALVTKNYLYNNEEDLYNDKLFNDIVSHFGKIILDDAGNINRKKLGNIIFNNDNEKKALENLSHPVVFEAEKRLRGRIRAKDDKAIIITHAALIIESGNYKNYELLIVVNCSKNNQIERLKKRNNINDKAALAIINSQLPLEEKLKFADLIIENSGGLDDLKLEVDRVYNLISTLNYGLKHS